MNPKDSLIKDLMNIFDKFEMATGVYIDNIAVDRISTKEIGDVLNKSVISFIKLTFR